MKIEVAYGTASRQRLVVLDVQQGCTVEQAIEASGIKQEFPDMVVDADRVGIFGRRVGLDTLLQPGERVEIYRPLTCDPRASRKRRAESA